MTKDNNTHSKTHVVINPDRGVVVSTITVQRSAASTKTTQRTESLTWERK